MICWKLAIFGGFGLTTLVSVHGTKRNLKGVFMVQKYAFLIRNNICYLACIWNWDMVFGPKTTVPHISNNIYGKPSNIYYKYIVKLTKSSINLTMNRYAQSIVKFAMIFSLFTTFLANPISYVVIFTWIFQKFTRDFENFTVLLTKLTWLLGLGNSIL